MLALSAAAFVLGRTTGDDNVADVPPATSDGDVTVRVGDQLRVPSIALFCVHYVELDVPKLLCNHTGRRPRYQVIFERDRTDIGRIGDPGDQRIFRER